MQKYSLVMLVLKLRGDIGEFEVSHNLNTDNNDDMIKHYCQ